MNVERDRFAAGLFAAWATEILTSFVVGVIYAISSAGGLPSLRYPDAGSGIFLVAGVFTFISAVVGFIATLALGIPVLKAFIRVGYTSGVSFFGAGVVIAAVLGAALYASHQFGQFLVDDDFHFAILAIVISGPLAALAFWLVHRRRDIPAAGGP
jgi:hypothetical protein